MKLVENKLKKFVEKGEWKETDENTYVVCEVDVYLNKKRRDSDNIFKVLLDSINSVDGIIYDDSMIIPRIRNVIIDKDNPRLEIELRKSKKVGVFTKDSSEYFLKHNCSNCSRYLRNCSILKKSYGNKIVKEVDLDSLTCSARKIKKKSNE